MKSAAFFGMQALHYRIFRLSRCRGASCIEDESAYGTFHIGFGRNLALGGAHNAASYFDIVVHNSTIITGESVLMKDGESCAWF